MKPVVLSSLEDLILKDFDNSMSAVTSPFFIQMNVPLGMTSV